MILAGVLADPTGEAAKAGPLAILVILLLCVACYFIFRSMSKHLRRVRDEFPYGAPSEPEEPAPDAQPPADEDSPHRLTS